MRKTRTDPPGRQRNSDRMQEERKSGHVSRPRTYVDDYLLIRVQHSDESTRTVFASTSVVSDHAQCLIRRWGEELPCRFPRKNADWVATSDALTKSITSSRSRCPTSPWSTAISRCSRPVSPRLASSLEPSSTAGIVACQMMSSLPNDSTCINLLLRNLQCL